VVTRLDRLARSTSELLRIAERLTEKSAGLQSLDEAEFERTLILSRTTDGRLAAKARGVAFGRARKMRPDQQELAREFVRDGKSISAVARTFDVHPATIYRVIEG
jgi:DNA invertase Pin-like site-specific DNA recombinase